MDKETALGAISTLLKIQSRDVELARCRRELAEIPHLQAAANARLTANIEAVDKAHADLQTQLVAIKNAEMDIEAKRQHIVKMREQQLQVKTNEEYRALNRQIESVEDAVGKVETTVLELMEAADATRKREADLKGELEAARAMIASEAAALEDRKRALQSKIDSLLQERNALSPDVPAEWMTLYDRILDNRKDVALVPIVDHACGGCHLKVTAQTLQDVKRAEQIVTCPYCGRLLHWSY